MKESLESCINGLLDQNKAIIASRLSAVSYLAPEELRLFKQKLRDAPLKRKLELLDRLVLVSTASSYLNFDEIFSFCLKDSSPEVRLKAIEALSGTAETQVVRYIVNMLLEDTDDRVKIAACSFLAPIALKAELNELPQNLSSQVENALRLTWENDRFSTECKCCALESLSYISKPYVLEAIEKAYSSEIKEMKISSIVGMGHSLDSRWVPVIIKELSNPDEAIRLEAINACGELADQSLIPHLMPLLDAPEPIIKFASITALGHIGGPAAEEKLRTLLKDEDPEVSEAARNALEEVLIVSETFRLPVFD